MRILALFPEMSDARAEMNAKDRENQEIRSDESAYTDARLPFKDTTHWSPPQAQKRSLEDGEKSPCAKRAKDDFDRVRVPIIHFEFLK